MRIMGIPPLTDADARERMEAFIADLPPVPSSVGSGRGVVVCGGGIKYLPCAWVCINMLRRLGCQLPIELWHMGEKELPEAVRRLLRPLNVRFRDALEVLKEHPARILNGWELKPYAIIHSDFEEVLALDADNVPVVEPTFLFDTPQYAERGAIFWPDYSRLQRTRAIWRVTGVTYQNEPEFESGQIVVCKRRCWHALALTMWMNENSDFFYRHVHGDKETFHIAWRKLNQAYAMPDRGIRSLAGTMCQHDFDGRRIFQHRNMRKWTLGVNVPVAGFEFENACLQFLEELRPLHRVIQGFPEFDEELSRPLVGASVTYRRVGHDTRSMVLEPNGTVGQGGHRMERLWGIREHDGVRSLEIYGDDGTTARLRESADRGRWRGAWLIHERMPVEIDVLKPAVAEDRLPPQAPLTSPDGQRVATVNLSTSDNYEAVGPVGPS